MTDMSGFPSLPVLSLVQHDERNVKEDDSDEAAKPSCGAQARWDTRVNSAARR
jgi:hypothetical protein